MLTTAPGLALKTLFSEVKADVLRKILDSSIIDILKIIDPNFISNDNFSSFISNIIDPYEILRDTDKREQIIRLLPLPKARELAKKLHVEDGKNLYLDLCRASSNNEALPILLSFFGVVRDIQQNDSEASNTCICAGYGLFKHQRIAADNVILSLTKAPKKVVLHMPTGSGKTRTAMHIISLHLKDNEPTVVCWLAQNAELLEQAANEFEYAWNYLGNRQVELIRFWGNRNPDIMSVNDGLVVSGLGKMHAYDNREPANMLRFADRTSLIVIDEAHQAIAPTYSSILTALYTKRPKNALLGLTATPGRTWSDILEDQKLSDYFDNEKVTLQVDGYSDAVTFLINEGYIAKPIFKTLNSDAGVQMSVKDIENLSESIDIPDTILAMLGADTRRNLQIVTAVEELITRHNRIIVFASSVHNAKLLTAILIFRGVEASIVTGETNTSARERIIRRFKSSVSTAMVLINYGVLTTGFDAPSISAAVIARPTRSLVLYSQMVGRAIRGPKAGGNKEAEIITVVDPNLPGFGSIADAFKNWEDVWNEQ